MVADRATGVQRLLQLERLFTPMGDKINRQLGFNWGGEIEGGSTNGDAYHLYYFVNDIAIVGQGWGYSGDYENS